ncbi:MAG TPA: class I SAM-dependent methyltransferase [Pirellulaceae bacterium]|nr:class I SAM-dependent methyltransferase [Pirellulaceae bacterium]
MTRLSEAPVDSKLSRVNHFFTKQVGAFKQCLMELDAEIDPDAVPQRDDEYHRRTLHAFQESQDACRDFEEENGDDPDLILDAQQGFRQETDPWFARSWIAHRARTKPSGFAGDFEMLIKLYDEATPARGLGGYLDLCILELPLARAVRARLAAAREFLMREIASRKTDIRILDIACGPCREFRDWPVSGNGCRVDVVAMDNDPKALAYVEENVAKQLAKPTNLEPVRYNALRTRSASATIRNFGKFDIIYSVGLCDYLSDEHLVAMLSAWRETLQEGGVLYIAFKDTESYDKTPYQWHLDWFFFQRTRQDVLNLYEAAGFDIDRVETTRDATGIIINYVDRLPVGKFSRVDGAQEVIKPHSGQHAFSPHGTAHIDT